MNNIVDIHLYVKVKEKQIGKIHYAVWGAWLDFRNDIFEKELYGYLILDNFKKVSWDKKIYYHALTTVFNDITLQEPYDVCIYIDTEKSTTLISTFNTDIPYLSKKGWRNNRGNVVHHVESLKFFYEKINYHNSIRIYDKEVLDKPEQFNKSILLAEYIAGKTDTFYN
ncbi:hypothetical protein KY334_07175 [Candidatus Woesearchaeota archaeon]|nr:hypothetical protein [Candidatus Woesearchaeota archaeon]